MVEMSRELYQNYSNYLLIKLRGVNSFSNLSSPFTLSLKLLITEMAKEVN